MLTVFILYVPLATHYVSMLRDCCLPDLLCCVVIYVYCSFDIIVTSMYACMLLYNLEGGEGVYTLPNV